MTEVLPPPDDPTARQFLLAGADAMIGRLIDLAHAILDAAAPGTLGAATRRHLIAHILVPAEAALRRALVFLAASRPAPQPGARQAKPVTAPPAADAPRKTGPRPPRFRLFEPPLRRKADYLPLNQCPRISIAGDPPPPPAPRRPADPAALDARLARRLDALKNAFENPEREVRRLLRDKARRGDRPLLRLTAIPGRAANELSPEDHILLRMLNAAAAETAPGRPDTS